MFLSWSLGPVTVFPYMEKALSDVIKLMVLEMRRVSFLTFAAGFNLIKFVLQRGETSSAAIREM